MFWNKINIDLILGPFTDESKFTVILIRIIAVLVLNFTVYLSIQKRKRERERRERS